MGWVWDGSRLLTPPAATGLQAWHGGTWYLSAQLCTSAILRKGAEGSNLLIATLIFKPEELEDQFCCD